MRWLVLICVMWPFVVVGQSKTVLPSELELSVTVEEADAVPLVREMVLINIRGVFRRHITREQLIQPDFEGFSWAQLGPDSWKDERIDGKKVKVLTRRMAIYPDRAGTLTIGAFTHKLTLTDEGDDWFDHEIQSEPITLTVAEAPAHDEWWFPVRSLKVADDWSNAPDQLTPGEGVLRVVRIEALGVTPEMIPPMPDLESPSAMIFPHPEKRLVELTPEGPVTYAFWRWTIRPSNDTSTIVEPLTFSYFDTVHRDLREVTISAQRVAYGTVTGQSAPQSTQTESTPSRLPGWFAAMLGALVFGFGTAIGLKGRQLVGMRALQRFPLFDPLARRMKTAARQGDTVGLRRVSAEILGRDGALADRAELLQTLDQSVFDPSKPSIDFMTYADKFLGLRKNAHKIASGQN